MRFFGNRSALLATIALLGMGACSSASTPPADAAAAEVRGAGGSRGDGAAGRGAAGADGGTARDGAIDVAPIADAHDDAHDEPTDSSLRGDCLGACFQTLTAPCPTVPGCTTSTMGMQTVVCYSNGVKELKQIDGQNVDGTVKKANGDVCYRWVLAGTDETFMDVAGDTVAQLKSGPTDVLYTSTCEPGAVMKDVDLSTPECSMLYAISAQKCTPSSSCVW
jgi:hypothetical protein